MATLREVRRRISGVKQTQKITRAMKMVATAKLRRAQTNVVAARPYAGKMKELLQHLIASPESALGPLFAPREVKNVAIVVITTDRGFCGAFNSNVIKAAINHLDLQYPGWNEKGRVRLFCAGRKGANFFSKRQFTVAGSYVGFFNTLAFSQAQRIAQPLVEGYAAGLFDRVEIIYNEFKSLAQQRIVVEQFLPVLPDVRGTTSGKRDPERQYIYEPSQKEILDALVPRYLNFQLWHILLESNASEQGARMAAMDNATENAEELISQLQLQYNKARQASITKELLEIVSGAEALSKAG
jgi:F-type H+-transporting ATPase subunit gamma